MNAQPPVNIVCVSPAPWDYPIWTNRQHIIKRLSSHNKIVYVFHPALFRSSIKRIFKPGRIALLRHINSNLFCFTPPVLPFSGCSPKIGSLNIKISSFFLKKALKKIGFYDYILWFYDPEAVEYLDYLNPYFTCYDCVDEFAAMPSYQHPKKKKNLLEKERRLIKRSTIVFTTSMSLFSSKKSLNPNTCLVENVGDFDHFNSFANVKSTAPSDFPKGDSPVVGFSGAVDPYKVDFELISYLAQQRPHWRIVLIGGITDSKKNDFQFPKKKNIYYLGHKEYAELPRYLSQFDVCIIPYGINDYTQGVFPIKLFEYLATGKPVVTSSLPSLSNYSSIIRISESKQQFLSNIEDVLSNDSDTEKQARIGYAKENSWESRAERLMNHVYANIGKQK
jgi:glycosyltransferase involved in cell wall biosynthesis